MLQSSDFVSQPDPVTLWELDGETGNLASAIEKLCWNLFNYQSKTG